MSQQHEYGYVCRQELHLLQLFSAVQYLLYRLHAVNGLCGFAQAEYPSYQAELHSAHPYEEPAVDILPLENEYNQLGLGCIGELEEPINERDVMSYICRNLQIDFVRHTKLSDRMISKVALCGGSGAEFIPRAMAQGAEIYITADVKYHDFFNAENQIVIADVGHFESEQCIKEIFYEQLSKNFINFAILMADSDKSPTENYYRFDY